MGLHTTFLVQHRLGNEGMPRWNADWGLDAATMSKETLPGDDPRAR